MTVLVRRPRRLVILRERVRGWSWVRPDLTPRIWHPFFWWHVAVACLRYVGVLRRLCPECAGHGRQLKNRQLRRRACPRCHGSGYQKAVTA